MGDSPSSGSKVSAVFLHLIEVGFFLESGASMQELTPILSRECGKDAGQELLDHLLDLLYLAQHPNRIGCLGGGRGRHEVRKGKNVRSQ